MYEKARESSVKIAACQMPDVRADVRRTTALMRDWALEASRQGVGLVCFPEGFLQGYDLRSSHIASVAMGIDSDAFEKVLRELASVDPIVVFGFMEKHGNCYYNAAVAIERGRVAALYRKTCLLPPEQAVFEAGRECPVFDVQGTRAAIAICHDLAHAESVQRAASVGAQLLACPCSNLLPRPQAEAWKHRHNEIRCRQAHAHGLWIAAAEITSERDDCIAYGPTSIIDPRGVVVAQVPLGQVGMVVAQAV